MSPLELCMLQTLPPATPSRTLRRGQLPARPGSVSPHLVQLDPFRCSCAPLVMTAAQWPAAAAALTGRLAAGAAR